jgi:hypothetical protein
VNITTTNQFDLQKKRWFLSEKGNKLPHTHHIKTFLPTTAPSKESGPRGPGFDFTPEGCCLLSDKQWNNGMMEKWNIGVVKWMMV